MKYDLIEEKSLPFDTNCVETLRKGMHHPSKSPHRTLERNTCRSRLECMHASMIILGGSLP